MTARTAPAAPGRAGGPDGAGDVPGRPWPTWARGLASAALGFHLTAMLAVALAGRPASPLQQGFAGLFAGYTVGLNQDVTHRYYAPAPGPTPVVAAEIRYEDGRPSQTVRLPDRSVWPRVRYQRQLALAYHLNDDFQRARNAPGEPQTSRWARSYARHLGAAYPGASVVRLTVQQHLVPDLVALRELAGPMSPLPDVDDERFYTVPELIGEFPCQDR